MWSLKWEMEDFALPLLYPEELLRSWVRQIARLLAKSGKAK